MSCIRDVHVPISLVEHKILQRGFAKHIVVGVPRVTSSDVLSKIDVKNMFNQNLGLLRFRSTHPSDCLGEVNVFKSLVAEALDIICVLGSHMFKHHCFTRRLRHMYSDFL